ncbi:MAG: nucleoside hydrolase [Kiritimatiellia bacterium]
MDPEKIIDVIWDTDIGRDPDDFLAGCFLLSRPEIRVRAITISPGDKDQVALAKFLLKETGHADVPVGTVPERDKEGKTSVKGCHLRIMERSGVATSSSADGAGWQVIAEALGKYPQAVLFTSGPLNNIGDLLRKTTVEIRLSVSMAGYWAAPGEPESKPEFNFNGCGWAAREFVESKRFGRRLLVGKNVTHQVLYDEELHEQLRISGQTCRPLALAHELMTLRFERSKKLHDPLAAAALLREDIFQWQEVLPMKRNNNWSSVPMPGSQIRAATSVNIQVFRQLFAEAGLQERPH